MFGMERTALMKQVSDLQEYQIQNEQFLKKIREETLERTEAIEMVRKDHTLDLSNALEGVRRKKSDSVK
jgi:hypothetical protein